MTATSSAILLVEDDVFISRMMELKFAKSGLSVTMALSGKEALGLLDDQQFDLILTDLLMPEMSGLQLIQAIRKRPEYQEVPILVLSGMDNPDNIMAALKAGANDFMPKTKQHDLVIAKVKRELNYLNAVANRGGARASGDALWNWHIGRDEIQLSSRWKSMLGFAADEIGKHPEEWLNRIHKDDRPVVDESLQSHLDRKSGHFEADYRIQHKDGSWCQVHSFGVALFGKDGKPARMIGAMSLLSNDAFHARAKKSLLGLKAALAAGSSDEARKFSTQLSGLLGA